MSNEQMTAEIGQQVETQQEEAPVVPDKFKNEDGSLNQDALLKSYKELEDKQGQQTEDTAETTETTEGDYQETTEDNPSGEELPPSPIAEFEQEYEENGKLSEESYQKAMDTFNVPREVVDEFISNREKAREQASENQYEVVGGEEEFRKMEAWANETMTPEEIKAYNELANSPIPASQALAKRALESMHKEYKKAVGHDPKTTVSGRSSSTVVGFKSAQELVAFKRKPNFAFDPQLQAEFKQKILNKTY